MNLKFFKHLFDVRHRKAWVLLGLTIIAYFSAINRNHAMSWVIAAILLSALISAFLLPYILLRKLSIHRVGPNFGEEGKEITLSVQVNNSGSIPCFMLEAIDYLPFIGFSNDLKKNKEQLLGTIVYIGGGSVRAFDVNIVCEKRGEYLLGPVRLKTSFPLGLIEFVGQKDESIYRLIVYPNVFPIASFPLVGSPSEIHRGGYLLPKGVGSSEFSGLREYQRGDHPRHVHWPSTAKHQQLMIKEYEPLASACIYFAIDLAKDSNLGTGKHTTFEYTMSIAASIARFACDNSISQRVEGEGSKIFSIGPGVGEAHYQECLQAYATLDATGDIAYAKVLSTVAAHCREGDTVVAFISETGKKYEETLKALSLIKSSGAHIVSIVFDRQSFQSSESNNEQELTRLLELDATCIKIKNGDDLMRRFNI